MAFHGKCLSARILRKPATVEQFRSAAAEVNMSIVLLRACINEIKCFRCGKNGHGQRQCFNCFLCGQFGHARASCPNNPCNRPVCHSGEFQTIPTVLWVIVLLSLPTKPIVLWVIVQHSLPTQLAHRPLRDGPVAPTTSENCHLDDSSTAAIENVSSKQHVNPPRVIQGTVLLTYFPG